MGTHIIKHAWLFFLNFSPCFGGIGVCLLIKTIYHTQTQNKIYFTTSRDFHVSETIRSLGEYIIVTKRGNNDKRKGKVMFWNIIKTVVKIRYISVRKKPNQGTRLVRHFHVSETIGPFWKYIIVTKKGDNDKWKNKWLIWNNIKTFVIVMIPKFHSPPTEN